MWQSGYTSCHWVAALCRWPHQDKTAIQQLPACRISAELRGCSLRGTVGAGWQWVLAASIGHASNPAHTLLLTIYLRVLANPQLVGHLSLDFFFLSLSLRTRCHSRVAGYIPTPGPRPQREQALSHLHPILIHPPVYLVRRNRSGSHGGSSGVQARTPPRFNDAHTIA